MHLNGYYLVRMVSSPPCMEPSCSLSYSQELAYWFQLETSEVSLLCSWVLCMNIVWIRCKCKMKVCGPWPWQIIVIAWRLKLMCMNYLFQRAQQLSVVLKNIAAKEQFSAFSLHYLENPVHKVMWDWKQAGKPLWQLVDPVDS